MVNTSKKKIKGLEFTNTSKDVISIIFPRIALPQYYDNENYKFIEIKNDTELKQAIERKEKLSYGGVLLIPKNSTEAKELKTAIDTIWKSNDLQNNRKAEYPLKDGDIMAEKLEKKEKNGDAYKNCYYVTIDSKFDLDKKKKRFKCFNKYGAFEPLSNDEINGYYVRVGLYIGFYNFANNIGVKAYMSGIQFMSENPDLQFRTDYTKTWDFETAPAPEKEQAMDKVFEGDGSISQDEEDGGVSLTNYDNNSNSENPWN